MPPFLSSLNATIDSGDLQDAVDAYLAANPLDLTAHLAAADPHTGYQLESQRGVANGYCPLDGQGTVPDIRLPASIARDSEAQGYVTTHTNAADPHGDRAFATSSIATHAADTTSVHGIADTSVLETFTTAANRISDHNSATTNVHGIANTANLVTSSSQRLWPSGNAYVTTNQTPPGGAVDGDYWIAPAT
jgi:hypothetical protein